MLLQLRPFTWPLAITKNVTSTPQLSSIFLMSRQTSSAQPSPSGLYWFRITTGGLFAYRWLVMHHSFYTDEQKGCLCLAPFAATLQTMSCSPNSKRHFLQHKSIPGLIDFAMIDDRRRKFKVSSSGKSILITSAAPRMMGADEYSPFFTLVLARSLVASIKLST
jgi:hypothetical protein